MNDNPQKMPPVPPFVRFVASAVPMVFDNSLSYYEALCALWKYIQGMTDVINSNATLEEEFIKKVKELETYVNTYFDNLDVQEEINNKLDSMVESGEFDTILANYLVISGGNAKALGCAGDGVTDDTTAINSAITTLINSGIRKLVFPEGEYVVSGEIALPSDFTLEGMQGSVLKYVGDGTEGNILHIEGSDADDYKENIVIRNITINGSDQVYKGGYSMATPALTHTNPAYRGLVCVKIDYARDVTIEGCKFDDIYGEGIIIRYANNVYVNHNTLRDVSSGNIQQDGQTGYDNHGDAIASFFSFNVEFSNNTVINKRVYKDGLSNAIGKPCGRSGLEFEYAINQNASDADPDDVDYNAPNFNEIPVQLDDDHEKRYGVGLRMFNNYVYGYTKGIHLESKVKCMIQNNTILYNHIAIMCSIHNYTSFTGNYINPFGVGPAPQSGYDLYYSGIGLSEYSDKNKRYGIIVTDNTFEGDGKGVILATNYATITNNRFNCQKGIYCQKSQLKGINVSNNTFNSTTTENFDYFLFLYNIQSGRVINNSFYSETINENAISGNNIVISNNEFVNSRVNHNSGGENITITNNLFKGNTYDNEVLKVYKANDSLIDNNTFNIEDFNTSDKYVVRITDGTSNCTFSHNNFTVTTTRNDLQIVRFESINRTKIICNTVLNNVNVEFFRVYVSSSCEFRYNKIENCTCKLIHHYGSFEGATIYECNEGVLDGSGYKPNDGLGRFVNNYFNKSQQMYKYNISGSVTSLGWVCTGEGYYVTDSWTSGTSYNANKLLKNSSDNVYKCITKGSSTSTVEPTHTTFDDVTESDGYKWRYCGSVATFKELAL